MAEARGVDGAAIVNRAWSGAATGFGVAAAAAVVASAGSGPLNGDAAAYAASLVHGAWLERWTHAGWLALVGVGWPIGRAIGASPGSWLDGASIAASAAAVWAGGALAARDGADRRTAAAATAAVIAPWAAFGEVDPAWIALVVGAAAGPTWLAAAAVAVSPTALLAVPWACAARRSWAPLGWALAAVAALTALSAGGWWTGERGVLTGPTPLVGRTLGAWAWHLPWLLAPAVAAAGGDRRLLWLVPLALAPPDVPAWLVIGVALGAVGARVRRGWVPVLVAAQLALGMAELGWRAARVRRETQVVERVAAALGPDDGLVAPWSWGARVAVARTGDVYGMRWRTPTGFVRDQASAWCDDVPVRAIVLPASAEADAFVWLAGPALAEGCGAR